MHIRNLLNHGLVFRKVHKAIRFSQNAWLKLYIDMNTDLRKKLKMTFKIFFKLINNARFGKNIENLRKKEMLNLSQQKEEETIWCQNKIIILQSFSQQMY